MSSSLRIFALLAFGLSCMAHFNAPALAQAGDPEAMIRQMMEQAGAGGTMPPAAGIGGLPVQKGTWVYPVRASTLQLDAIGDRDFGVSKGVDADFMARASVFLTKVVPGPDLCNPNEPGMSDFRQVAMQVWTGNGPFMAGEQLSRLVVNQETAQAALYLHGDVREWAPGETFCADGGMAEISSGKGMLRMEYTTAGHIAPLHFVAYPRASDIDPSDFENACAQFENAASEMYREMNRNWGMIVHGDSGPVDWSTFGPPPVPEGFNNGSEASFGDGTFNMRQAVDAVGNMNSGTGLLNAVLAPIFQHAPRIAAGVGGVVSWAVVEAVNRAAGQSFDSSIATMIEMVTFAGQAFHGGDPATRKVAEHAQQRVSDNTGTYEGLNVDYMVSVVLDACSNIEEVEIPSGYAAGHMSWPRRSVHLIGRGPVSQAPAAHANGPVSSMSIADALAMARAMSGGSDVPDAEQLQAMMPAGISLDALPIAMNGQAHAGDIVARGLREWSLTYNVELVDEGEKIAALWFDPRR